MSLRVVEDKTTEATGMQMQVTIASENQVEVTGRQGHDFAKAAALKKGFRAHGMCQVPEVYPVNDQGECTDKVILGQEPIKEYHGVYQFSAPI